MAGASLVLAASMSLTACGGPPEDASREDFCTSFDFSKIADKPSQDEWDEFVDGVKDTGTPEGIPDDAREGYEAIIDALEGVDVDDDNEDLQKLLTDLEKDSKTELAAFNEYFGKTCTG